MFCKMGRAAPPQKDFFLSQATGTEARGGRMHGDAAQWPACLKAWGFSNRCPGDATVCSVGFVSLNLWLNYLIFKCPIPNGSRIHVALQVGSMVTEMPSAHEAFCPSSDRSSPSKWPVLTSCPGMLSGENTHYLSNQLRHAFKRTHLWSRMTG